MCLISWDELNNIHMYGAIKSCCFKLKWWIENGCKKKKSKIIWVKPKLKVKLHLRAAVTLAHPHHSSYNELLKRYTHFDNKIIIFQYTEYILCEFQWKSSINQFSNEAFHQKCARAQLMVFGSSFLFRYW